MPSILLLIVRLKPGPPAPGIVKHRYLPKLPHPFSLPAYVNKKRRNLPCQTILNDFFGNFSADGDVLPVGRVSPAVHVLLARPADGIVTATAEMTEGMIVETTAEMTAETTDEMTDETAVKPLFRFHAPRSVQSYGELHLQLLSLIFYYIPSTV